MKHTMKRMLAILLTIGIVAHLLEQDFYHNAAMDSKTDTLYQRGYLLPEDSGNFPIYHYTQDDPRALMDQLRK